jgi:hypothetical protein
MVPHNNIELIATAITSRGGATTCRSGIYRWRHLLDPSANVVCRSCRLCCRAGHPYNTGSGGRSCPPQAESLGSHLPFASMRRKPLPPARSWSKRRRQPSHPLLSQAQKPGHRSHGPHLSLNPGGHCPR